MNVKKHEHKGNAVTTDVRTASPLHSQTYNLVFKKFDDVYVC